jgi:chromosome segregation ATPase
MEHAVAQRGQMQITQHRFEELSNNIERMKQQHINICHTVDMLTSELQQSTIVIANLQQQLSQAQTRRR